MSTLPERLLSPSEVAQIVGVDPRTIRKWEIQGRIPLPIRSSSRCVRYRWSEISRWIANGLEWPAPDYIVSGGDQ